LIDNLLSLFVIIPETGAFPFFFKPIDFCFFFIKVKDILSFPEVSS